MSNSFEDRERGFENKFARDTEFAFKVVARRNKLLGLWAAPYLGLEGQAAQDYAATVVQADFDEPGDEDVYRKVAADLRVKHAPVTEAQLRAKMAALLAEAQAQLSA
ncbi:DUF1476 domain-containing protein [Zavarzinia sp. CC-PAN008]|uniref:DUF1476 domain-containing protein n=1 Tax=Zavarzinia sp. CC-PAN008 TaxID=3243332 RepID=UPI003F7486B0